MGHVLYEFGDLLLIFRQDPFSAGLLDALQPPLGCSSYIWEPKKLVCVIIAPWGSSVPGMQLSLPPRCVLVHPVAVGKMFRLHCNIALKENTYSINYPVFVKNIQVGDLRLISQKENLKSPLDSECNSNFIYKKQVVLLGTG